mmetsp:Transcript_38297/g.80439  ORF Transcript_38297/g.80439 Transcript_38297/m.80439 type:complete len:196 (-) Transcript_38297:271-858(-)
MRGRPCTARTKEASKPGLDPSRDSNHQRLALPSELLAIHREHSVRIAEHDVRKKPVANHDQRRWRAARKLMLDALKATRLLMLPTQDADRKSLLDGVSFNTSVVIWSARRVRNDRKPLGAKDGPRILEGQLELRLKVKRIWKRKRVVLIKHESSSTGFVKCSPIEVCNILHFKMRQKQFWLAKKSECHCDGRPIP